MKSNVKKYYCLDKNESKSKTFDIGVIGGGMSCLYKLEVLNQFLYGQHIYPFPRN